MSKLKQDHCSITTRHAVKQ